MLYPNLIPRFRYNYRFIDIIRSLKVLIFNTNNSLSLSNYFGNRDIFFANYGRTCLRIALSSLNLKRNSKIGVQLYNCETVFQSIVNAGHIPVFIDINNNFTLDINDLSNKNSKIDALIVTHTFGIVANVKEIKNIVKNKPIIEDCAHSLFSYYDNGIPTGILGDLSIFSFGYGKFPSIGNGGFLVCNNKQLKRVIVNEIKKIKSPSIYLEILNIFKNYSISMLYKTPLYGLLTYPLGRRIDEKFDLVNKKSYSELKGYKTNTSVFLHNFNYYKTLNLIKKKKVTYFFKRLSEKINMPFLKYDNQNNFIIPFLHKKAERIHNELFNKGFESSQHFKNSVLIGSQYGYKRGDCVNAEKIVNEIFTVPIHDYLKKEKLNNLINIIAKQFSKE